MPNLAELLIGDLDAFSHTDVDRIVASLGDETERVELKRDWPPNRDLAHDVCALANGFGGAIVIGYEDPKLGSVSHMVGTSPRIDGALAAIHSLTWPSVRCAIRSLQGADGHTVVVISVPPTENGPHEYIGGNKSNLPVRRGRSTKTLTLSEIFGLRRRAEGSSFEPPESGYPIISLSTMEKTFWGVSFSPTEWPKERFSFGHDEDMAFLGYWKKWWNPKLDIRPNGLQITQEKDEVSFSVAVHVDGTIVMWWRTGFRPWMYFVALLDQAYGFASFVFYHLNLAPRATMWVRWAVSDDAQDKRFPFSESGELTRHVDFSRDVPEELLTFFVEQADRLTGRSRPKPTILAEIQSAQSGSTPHEDARARWATT
jgi:schlafen family protein